jgi:hypothetical protein
MVVVENLPSVLKFSCVHSKSITPYHIFPVVCRKKINGGEKSIAQEIHISRAVPAGSLTPHI